MQVSDAAKQLSDSPLLWLVVIVVAAMGSLHTLRLLSQILLLLIRYMRRELVDLRHTFIQLRNEVTLWVDTSDTESVGKFINAVRDAKTDTSASRRDQNDD